MILIQVNLEESFLMSDESKYQKAVDELKKVYENVKLDNSKEGKKFKKTLDMQDIVLCHYGNFFKKENIEKTSDEELKTEFQNFLKFKSDYSIGNHSHDENGNHSCDRIKNHHYDHIGNFHWRGIGRNPEIFSHMDAFHEALLNLLEKVENKTKIGSDKDKSGIGKDAEIIACYNNMDEILGIGKAKITSVLLVASNGKDYGVWNTVSEEALKKLELWPDLKGTKNDGEKYMRVNEVLLNLVKEYNASCGKMDLWVLDALLCRFIGH